MNGELSSVEAQPHKKDFLDVLTDTHHGGGWQVQMDTEHQQVRAEPENVLNNYSNWLETTAFTAPEAALPARVEPPVGLFTSIITAFKEPRYTVTDNQTVTPDEMNDRAELWYRLLPNDDYANGAESTVPEAYQNMYTKLSATCDAIAGYLTGRYKDLKTFRGMSARQLELFVRAVAEYQLTYAEGHELVGLMHGAEMMLRQLDELNREKNKPQQHTKIIADLV